MRDKYSPERVAQLHPKIRTEVEQLINQAETFLPKNIVIRIVEHYRSFEYQNQLYAQGRTKPGSIVTNAKGGQSYHNYGLAFDFAFAVDKNGDGKVDELSWDTRADFNKNGISDWREVVNVFRKAGYIWGADWDNDGKTKSEGDKDEHLVDAPHLQKTFGFSEKQLLEKYNKGEVFIDNGNKYVKI